MNLSSRFAASVLVLVSTWLWAQSVIAQSAAPQQESSIPPSTVEMIYQRLQQGRPDLEFSGLRLSPLEGLYEVKINGQVAFVSKNGDYLLSGEMYRIDQSGFVNLQEQQRMEERAKTLATLNVDDMVVYKPEKTQGVAYIFTDIDCGFCRRLHANLDDYLEQGIEVRYLAFPRAGVPSNSAEKLATVWCADDRLALMDSMKQGRKEPINDCGTPLIATQYQLGISMGINGTPAIILESGKLIPGMVGPEVLVKEIGI